MQDYISANLPAIDFEQTRDFYKLLGFEVSYQSKGWMILQNQSMLLEFFHHPDLVPQESWFSACLRTQDLKALYQKWYMLDLTSYVHAKITTIESTEEIAIFCIVDPNGSLIRCIESKDE